MNLDRDMQSMIRLAAPLSGGLPTSVTLPNGAVVEAVVSIASVDETLIHESIVAGLTKKLTMSTALTGNLKTQLNVIWNGQTWGITQTSLEGNGAATVAYLGAAF